MEDWLGCFWLLLLPLLYVILFHLLVIFNFFTRILFFQFFFSFESIFHMTLNLSPKKIQGCHFKVYRHYFCMWDFYMCIVGLPGALRGRKWTLDGYCFLSTWADSSWLTPLRNPSSPLFLGLEIDTVFFVWLCAESAELPKALVS